jgi:hypothetical protein
MKLISVGRRCCNDFIEQSLLALGHFVIATLHVSCVDQAMAQQVLDLDLVSWPEVLFAHASDSVEATARRKSHATVIADVAAQ